jgi:hypothetical protein
MDGKAMNDKSHNGNAMNGKDIDANGKDDIPAEDININSNMECKSFINMHL